MRRASPAFLCAVVGACHCADPAPAPLRLDVVLAPGEVRCGPVTRESELIGGPQAFAQVGHAWRCGNARVRFIVQDAARPAGLSSRGGNLIDVDLARADEQVDGADTFREHASAIAGREIAVERIEVVNDGRNGEPGVLRVSGTPAEISLAPQAAFLAQPVEGRMFTDYILRPDSDVIEIATTFENAGAPLPNVISADFVAFGGATHAHSPELGFSSDALFHEVTFLSAGRGQQVSYAFVCDGADLTLPFVDQGITAPLCAGDAAVGSARTFVRYLVVGDGTLESVARRAWQLRGIATGTLTGVVVDPSGVPVPGALVSAWEGEGDDEHVVNETRTAADGAFELTLPPGARWLTAHAPERGRSADLAITVAEGATTDVGNVAIGAAGHVVVRTTFSGSAGNPLGSLPAKLTLVPVDAPTPRAPLADFEADGAAAYQVSPDGRFDVAVPPGRYTLYVTRGFEHARFHQVIDVMAGVSVEVDAHLVHELDSAGLLGAEFHQHSLGSVDAEVPVAIKVLENAAEGVEVAAATDHDVVTDFWPHVRAFGLERHLFAMAGDEVSYQGIGHFNAYPWQRDPLDPHRDDGTRMFWMKTVPQLFADIRASAGEPLVQVNHPRSQIAGYFMTMRLNPVDATRIARDPPGLPTYPPTIYQDWDGSFDCLEVNGNFGDIALYTPDGRAALSTLAEQQGSDVPALADYFALLGAGLPVVAMGNSDTHHYDEGVGYPRNFLGVGTDEPAAMSEDLARAAVRAQQVWVGQGCLLELLVGDERRAGRGAMAKLDDPLAVRLQAPSHVAPGTLEMYVNGMARSIVVTDKVVLDPAGALDPRLGGGGAVERLRAPLTGLPTGEGDLVVVALSRGGHGLSPTGGGGVFCYSAPLYVDMDGDGAFTGWLEATQQVR
ncbi:MAG: carboxypeptidase regulatory-like domain-containing protein [Deltaproteobacteria bacterium]|nr:carboxypeptidase regulatory-like domain-containing protein [Deltaproteobacteria bacterium]